MRYAVVHNGATVNIVSDPEHLAPEFEAIASDTAQIGDLWDGEAFSPAPPMAPAVPAAITPRQLRLWVLRNKGLTPDAMESAIQGAIADPAAREEALITFRYALTIERDNPLTLQTGALLGMSDAELDAAFVEAAGL